MAGEGGFIMTDIIVAFITAAFAFVAGFLVNIQGKAQFFSTIVSKERMVWIKDIRRLSEELFSICEQYDGDNIPQEQYALFFKARNGILARLDPAGWYVTDDELIELLIEPDFVRIKASVPRIREILMTLTKNEWDKVKIEAGNNPWKVRKVKKIQDGLRADNTVY